MLFSWRLLIEKIPTDFVIEIDQWKSGMYHIYTNNILVHHILVYNGMQKLLPLVLINLILEIKLFPSDRYLTL